MRPTARVVAGRDPSSSASLEISNRTLVSESFADRTVDQFLAVNAEIRHCDFRRCRVDQACFGGGVRDSIYLDCVFDDSVIGAPAPGAAYFENCSFRNVYFSVLNCFDVQFVNCVFSGEITKGFFNGTCSPEVQVSRGRKENKFFGNDFSEMKLKDVSFRTGIELETQKLPTGPDYLVLDNPAKLLELGSALSERLLPEHRRALSIVLQLIDREFNAGQRAVFFNTAAFPRRFNAAFKALASVQGEGS